MIKRLFIITILVLITILILLFNSLIIHNTYSKNDRYIEYSQKVLKMVNKSVKYFKKGDSKKAITILNDTINADSKCWPAYSTLGSIYNNLGNYQLAIEYFTKGIKLNKEDPNMYIERGAAYRLTKEYQKSLNDFNNALLVYNKDKEKFDKLYKNILPEILYWNSMTLYYMGKHKEALAKVSDAIYEIKPANPKYYFQRGDIYFWGLGQYDKAKEDYAQAVNFAKKISDKQTALDTYFALVYTYFALGKYNDIPDLFKKVPQKTFYTKRKIENIQYALLLEKGEYKTVIPKMERYVKKYNDYAEGYLNLGGAYYITGQFSLAESCSLKAIELNNMDRHTAIHPCLMLMSIYGKL